MLSGGAVSWKYRRQDCVSLSTSEAEYVAASQCGQEVVYLREILGDFGFPPTGPTRHVGKPCPSQVLASY